MTEDQDRPKAGDQSPANGDETADAAAYPGDGADTEDSPEAPSTPVAESSGDPPDDQQTSENEETLVEPEYDEPDPSGETRTIDVSPIDDALDTMMSRAAGDAPDASGGTGQTSGKEVSGAGVTETETAAPTGDSSETPVEVEPGETGPAPAVDTTGTIVESAADTIETATAPAVVTDESAIDNTIAEAIAAEAVEETVEDEGPLLPDEPLFIDSNHILDVDGEVLQVVHDHGPWRWWEGMSAGGRRFYSISGLLFLIATLFYCTGVTSLSLTPALKPPVAAAQPATTTSTPTPTPFFVGLEQTPTTTGSPAPTETFRPFIPTSTPAFFPTERPVRTPTFEPVEPISPRTSVTPGSPIAGSVTVVSGSATAVRTGTVLVSPSAVSGSATAPSGPASASSTPRPTNTTGPDPTATRPQPSPSPTTGAIPTSTSASQGLVGPTSTPTLAIPQIPGVSSTRLPGP